MLDSPALTAARKRLLTHPIYAEVDTLERHIFIDGEEHGPAAEAMLEALVAEAPEARAAAAAAACEAVDARIAL